MFACQQRSFGVRMMEVIGRGEMDDVNIRVSQHVIERAVQARDTKLSGFLLCLLSGAFCQPQHIDAISAQPLDMGGSDETRPCHANADGLFGQLFCHKSSFRAMPLNLRSGHPAVGVRAIRLLSSA